MTTLGEEDVLLAAHGTYADGRTIPLVLMQNEERRYLGKPFTPCADGYVNVSRGKQEGVSCVFMSMERTMNARDWHYASE